MIGAAVELVSQVFVEKRDEVDWKAVGFEAGVSEAAAGFATDTAKQILVEGKELQKVDFGQAVKTSAIAGATGMLGAVIGIFGKSAKEALKEAKESPKFGAADGLRAETRVRPKGGNTRYVSGGVYRRPVQDYPNLRSSHGHYTYIGKYVEVDYVGDNPWEKTVGYYSSWKNAGNGAAGKQIGNSVAGKEGSFASASGRSAKVDQIVEVMKRGKISNDGRRIITDLDDRTRVIFGLDVGNNAHRLDIGGYTNPVDHMNIEIQVSKTRGNVRIAWDLHLILDKNRQVINQIITGDRARRK